MRPVLTPALPQDPALPEQPWWRRLGTTIVRERWLWLLFSAALAVRLHWNLVVHPLGDYIYSDMNGYVQRADRLLDHPDQPHEYSSFFPYGTHVMLAGIKLLFGQENYTAVGIIYALFGAVGVALCYAVARRASRFPVVAPAAGILAVFYYPHLSLGGYILSEVPFSTFLMAALLCALRLADHGRARDAWMMGMWAGIGAAFRPQMLLSAAAVGLFWLARRKSLPNIRFKHLLLSAVPLAIVLAASSALLHFNTGRWGLISENGSFNLVFGRCHNSKIESLPDGEGHGRVHFRPPPFLQLKNLEAKQRAQGLEPEAPLEPAIADELSYRGYIGDREVHMEYIRECIRKTGLWGQLRYSYTNVMLLWRYNIPWPDSGRSAWRAPARWWMRHHRDYLAVPALLMLGVMFVPGPKTAKTGLVAVNLLALLVLAAIYFGGIRHRTPYDFVVIIMAFETYALLGWMLWRGLLRWTGRARASGATSAGKADSPSGGTLSQTSSSS